MKPFSIIANNCWGTYAYQSLKIEYADPFVNSFMHPTCYIKLATRLRWYLTQSITFIDISQHDNINALRLQYKNYYPIALLHDVEVHCLHYDSREEVLEKWPRRVERVAEDDSRLYFKLCDNNNCTPEQLEEFDALPWKNKVCFTSKPMPHIKSAIYVPGESPVPLGKQPLDVWNWASICTGGT
jgi:uncharacterized protein (DUF1919 family)